MEFPFNVNSVLTGKICVVDQALIPRNLDSDRTCENTSAVLNTPADNRMINSEKLHRFERKNAQHLSDIINAMGEASALAQKLPTVITTVQRLKESENHLYLIKDEDANRGQGVVVGILKVGPKHLFVIDRSGQQYECTPLCVLDFYVHESRQRKGYGHDLFQRMLKGERVEPQHMAVDRPSAKFLAFLQKFYSLGSPIQQPNNFVLFDGFFINNPVLKSNTRCTSFKQYSQSEDKNMGLHMPGTSSPPMHGKNAQNSALKHILYSDTQTKEQLAPFSRRCFSDEGRPSVHNHLNEVSGICLQGPINDEFHTPIKQLKNSASAEDCNSYKNSSWWKVLGITPRTFDHPNNLTKTITRKPDRAQRRLW